MKLTKVAFLLFLFLLGYSLDEALADGYDLPTDLVIESDCDIQPQPEPEPITIRVSL